MEFVMNGKPVSMKTWCIPPQLFQGYYLLSGWFNATILAMQDRSIDSMIPGSPASHVCLPLDHNATTITDPSFHPFMEYRNSYAHSHTRYCRA